MTTKSGTHFSPPKSSPFVASVYANMNTSHYKHQTQTNHQFEFAPLRGWG